MPSIIIPVKSLKEPKTRLSPILNLEERRKLATVMFQDVLNSALKSRLTEHVMVVCGDEEIAQLSEDADIVIQESSQKGLNAAIVKGVNYCEKHGGDSVLIIPADIPLVEPKDLDTVLEAGRTFNVVICPCEEGEGTNALSLTPPHILTPRYGEKSFIRHIEDAEKKKASIKILYLRNIALDIDHPEDLLNFYNIKSLIHTTSLLKEDGFCTRLKNIKECFDGRMLRKPHKILVS